MEYLEKLLKVDIRSPDRDTKFLNLVVGVSQGDTSSLFYASAMHFVALLTSIIILDWRLPKSGTHDTLLKQSCYRLQVDDLALLSDTTKEPTKLIHHAGIAARKIGLIINVEYIEILNGKV